MEGQAGLSRTARFEKVEIAHILLKMWLQYFIRYNVSELCGVAEFIFLHSQREVHSRALTTVASSLGTGRSIWHLCDGEKKFPPSLKAGGSAEKGLPLSQLQGRAAP